MYALTMNAQAFNKNLAGVEGFEPPTVGFGDRCSTNWNYAPATALNYTEHEGGGKCFIHLRLTTGWFLGDLGQFAMIAAA